MHSVRPSRESDAAFLAPRLRQADLMELEAAGHTDPLAVLKLSYTLSRPCYSVVNDQDEAVTMFGVAPDLFRPTLGYIWLLGSEDIGRNRVRFLRHTQEWVERMQSQFLVLTNRVDARNEVHIRWLRWCGFTFINKVPGAGPDHLPFYEFVRIQIPEVPDV